MQEGGDQGEQGPSSSRLGTSARAGNPRADYTLARLASRRTVRAAMAISALRQGIGAARELWSTPTAVDTPISIDPRLPYPELRVAHIGTGDIATASAPAERLRVDSWRTRLTHVRPDLVLIDGPGTLSTPDELRDMVAHANKLELPVVAIGTGVNLAAQAGLTERLDAALPFAGSEATAAASPAAGATLDPWVDDRVFSPIGLDPRPTGRWRWDPSLSCVDQSTMAREHAVVTAPLTGRDLAEHAVGVLRILAAGVPVVAERTPLLTHLLAPHDDLLVEAEELTAIADDLLTDEATRERTSVRLRRHVLAKHTSRNAFEQVLAATGLPQRPPPTISVLLATRRPDQLADALAAVDRQDHPNLDVQLVLHGIEPDIPGRALSSGRTLQVHHVGQELPLGAALNVGLDAATGSLIAKMDDDDLYGAGHLSDLLVALGYSGADAVGRWSNIVHLRERDRTVHQHIERQERWTHHLPGCTLLVHGDVLRSLRWRLLPRAVDTELVRAIHGAGGHCYSTHRFGFIRRRHGDHTFTRSDRTFAGEGPSEPGLDRSALDV